jgi:hypothetical protein
MKDKEIELVDVKTKSRKNDEVRLLTSKSELTFTDPASTFLQLLLTIEGYIQCQICMDLLDKPFAYVAYAS